jgi:hypothetical protein
VNYLFGDSTPSALRTNFLELLRDALDFGVFVLQADESIKTGRATSEALTEEATDELARLDAFAAVVQQSIADAEKGDLGSPTATYAIQLADLARAAQREMGESVRAKLAADIAAIDADEASSRAACHDALFAFLAPHGESEAQGTRRIALLESGRYAPTLSGRTSFGVEWTLDLRVPEENIFSDVVRLERISPQIEIMTPQVTGWITKEVKVKPQRIERHSVTELVTDGAHTFVKLRVEASVETGFDVEIDEAGTLKMTRVGPSDDASVGAFDLDAASADTVRGIVMKLVESAHALESAQLAQAMAGDAPFRDVSPFQPLVERLVAELAPIVREISQRSLTANELVLRRALGDDRREEFFVTKATLREKYSPLPPALRALFTPLGFDAPPLPPSKLPPPPPPSEKTAPLARAEIKPSAPSQPPAPAAAKSPSVAPQPPPAPAPTLAKPLTPSSASGKNEAFVEAVKKIVLVLKSGRTDEGYTQYAELLSSPAFAEYRADDQRQALKLLLLAKAPARSDAVSRAYKIALQRIQSLVDTLAEPADYEMLGVAHLQLEDRTAASAAFDIALKLERARNPQSELCASLGRRIAQI